MKIPDIDDPRYLRELPPGHRQLIAQYATSMRKHVIGSKPTNQKEHEQRVRRLDVEYAVISRLSAAGERIWGVAKCNGLAPPEVLIEGFLERSEAEEWLRKHMVGQVTVRVPKLGKLLSGKG